MADDMDSSQLRSDNKDGGPSRPVKISKKAKSAKKYSSNSGGMEEKLGETEEAQIESFAANASLEPVPMLPPPVKPGSLAWVESLYTSPLVKVKLTNVDFLFKVPLPVVELCPALKSHMDIANWADGPDRSLSFSNTTKAGICVMFYFLQHNAYPTPSEETSGSPRDLFDKHAEVYKLAILYKIPELSQLAADAMASCVPPGLQGFLPTAVDIVSRFPVDAVWLDTLVCQKIEESLEAPDGSTAHSDLETLIDGGGAAALKIYKVTRAFDQKPSALAMVKNPPTESPTDEAINDNAKSDAGSEPVIIENEDSSAHILDIEPPFNMCADRSAHLASLTKKDCDSDLCRHCNDEYRDALAFCKSFIVEKDLEHPLNPRPKRLKLKIPKARESFTLATAVVKLLETGRLLDRTNIEHPCLVERPKSWKGCSSCIEIRAHLASALTARPDYVVVADAIRATQTGHEGEDEAVVSG